MATSVQVAGPRPARRCGVYAALGYELHLDGEEWIVLHGGVEESRCVRAAQALAHARQGRLKRGKDRWSFRLGFRGR